MSNDHANDNQDLFQRDCFRLTRESTVVTDYPPASACICCCQSLAFYFWFISSPNYGTIHHRRVLFSGEKFFSPVHVLSASLFLFIKFRFLLSCHFLLFFFFLFAYQKHSSKITHRSVNIPIWPLYHRVVDILISNECNK